MKEVSEEKRSGNVSDQSPEAVGDAAASMAGGSLFCAESVVLAVAAAHGIESALLPGIATGFCSGLSRTSGPCGALMGGVMALGMVKGRPSPGGEFLPCYEMVQELTATFEERFGATTCYGITGFDLSTAEGRNAFAEQAIFEKTCKTLVRETTTLVQELLQAGA